MSRHGAAVCRTRFAAAALIIGALSIEVWAQAPAAPVEVRVADAAGRPVADARIVVRYADGSMEQGRSDASGSFRLAARGPFPAHLQAFAPGWALFETELRDREVSVTVALRPSGMSDSVTVTASRTESAAMRSVQSVILLPRDDHAASPALSIDDYLRRVPGFTLFRRTSSFVAHPTAQGVSLRGVGPSGASRSLVLLDGTPLNDPFGGWVYWGRLPRVALDRVEILRGGASELYGSDALGGVIQLFRRPTSAKTLTVEVTEGNLGTRDYGFFASHRMGRHGVALAGEYFRTDGYNQVAPAERGSVDIAARSRHRALEAMWDVRFGPSGRAWIVASEYSEHRGNGTLLQTNDTQMKSLAAGTNLVVASGELNVQAFALEETFDAFFSAIATDRRSESLTRSQRVPASTVGAQALWRRTLGSRHLLLTGADYAFSRGASDEVGFAAAGRTGTSRADGRQDRGGLYVQDLFQVASGFDLLFGMRLDRWVNHDAFLFTHTLATGARRQTPFASRGDLAWSPKAGARLELGGHLALRTAVTRSFRAPTLNELYRGFRVGNVMTRENPELGPERAAAGEIGLDWDLRSRGALRGTIFWAEIDGSIANVTLTSTPALITRQRQNLGTTRSRGLELDALLRFGPSWTVKAGYFLSDATVRSAPLAPEIIGLRLPQVPRHQAVLEAAYRRPGGLFATAAVRLSGAQFDDDQNRLRLRGYPVLDLSAGKRLVSGVDLFAACENLFDHPYPVGRTPVETLGMPRRLHVGLRFKIE